MTSKDHPIPTTFLWIFYSELGPLKKKNKKNNPRLCNPLNVEMEKNPAQVRQPNIFMSFLRGPNWALEAVIRNVKHPPHSFRGSILGILERGHYSGNEWVTRNVHL